MNDQGESFLDKEEWHREASAVINDLKDLVKEMALADIPSSNSRIYCNLTTLEGNKYCIELTASGFRIVGELYNDTKLDSEQYFETPYSLLDTISPLYRQSFSAALQAKLLALADPTE